MRNALEMYRNTKYNINTISAYKRVYNKRQQSFLQTFAYTTKRQYTNFLSSLEYTTKDSNHFCKPSFPGHLLILSYAYGLRPPHLRQSFASVHVNLDTAEILLSFCFNYFLYTQAVGAGFFVAD